MADVGIPREVSRGPNELVCCHLLLCSFVLTVNGDKRERERERRYEREKEREREEWREI